MDLLPTEIYFKILNELPITNAGAQTLARCSMTGNSTLQAVSLEPALWKPHYEHRYRHAECKKEVERHSRLGEDWRCMYQERRRLDLEALAYLRIIEASSPKTRIEPARRIAGLGLDVWDALSEEKSRPLPTLFQKEEDIEKVKEGSPLTNLARKYWSSELLKIISRRNAIDQWSRLKRSVSDVESHPLSFEEAFATLSSFHGVLSDEIMGHINREVDDCRRYLEVEGIPYVQGTEGFETVKLCNAISAYMRSQGFDGAPPDDFHNFRNSLPHIFMTSARRSLPISLVFIFVAIARRIGLESYPLNTPNCVTALVPGAIVDVSQPHNIFTIGSNNYEEIKATLSVSHEMPHTIQLLARAARNISAARFPLSEMYRIAPMDLSQEDESSIYLQARYMSYCLSVLMGSAPLADQNNIISIMIGPRLSSFPLDFELVFRDKLLPNSSSTNPGRAARDIWNQLDVNQYDTINIWEGGSSLVCAVEKPDSIFAGQLVHAKDTDTVLYCVVGWKLQHGQIICSTINFGSHYVKDFPLAAVTPVLCSAQDLNRFVQNPTLGQYFEDAEVQEINIGTGKGRGRFIMNKQMMKLYPGDDVRGARWVRGEV